MPLKQIEQRKQMKLIREQKHREIRLLRDRGLTVREISQEGYPTPLISHALYGETPRKKIATCMIILFILLTFASAEMTLTNPLKDIREINNQFIEDRDTDIDLDYPTYPNGEQTGNQTFVKETIPIKEEEPNPFHILLLIVGIIVAIFVLKSFSGGGQSEV